MNADMNAVLTWADLQLLDAIVRERTLSGAARMLCVDQTTVSRHLTRIERRLEIRLFDRIGGRLSPAPELAPILGRLAVISEEAAIAIANLRRAQADLQSHVRIASVGFVSAHILAPALRRFSSENPRISLEIIVDDRLFSLERREADLALRLSNKAEEGALIKRIGAIEFRLYRPADTDPRDIRPVVRYSEDLDAMPEMRALNRTRPDATVPFRSNRLDSLIEAALSLGADIMLPERVGSADARFIVLDQPKTRAERPLYLLAHPERSRAPGVRAVMKWVEAEIKAWLSDLPIDGHD